MSKKNGQQPPATAAPVRVIDPAYALHVNDYIVLQKSSKQVVQHVVNAALATMIGVRRPDGFGDNGQRGWFQMTWESADRDPGDWPKATVTICVQPCGAFGLSASRKSPAYGEAKQSRIDGMSMEATCTIAKLLIEDLDRRTA